MQAFYAWVRGHQILVDSALGLFVAAFGLGLLGLPYLPRADAAAFVLAMAVPVALRRRYPVAAFAVVVIAGGIEVLVLPRPVASDLAVVILLYTLAAYRPRRLSVPGLAVCLLGSALAIARWDPPRALSSPYAIGAVAALFGGPAVTAWLLGDLMRWRRGYYAALEERAARLERERDAQAQVAAAAERARIARELHDVIAHNVSVMVVQADGGSYALDAAPERAREALQAISRTGRQALAEMRSLIGVLRSGDQGAGGPGGDQAAELAPQPGIGQIAGLLEQARAGGLPVSFTVEGLPREVPAGHALAAYRIVQESLTNARRHAGPAATAAVTLRFGEDELAVTVTDDGGGQPPRRPAAPGDGSGNGLTGMRERAEAFGGSAAAGPRPGGGWRVAATLPLPRPSGRAPRWPAHGARAGTGTGTPPAGGAVTAGAVPDAGGHAAGAGS